MSRVKPSDHVDHAAALSPLTELARARLPPPASDTGGEAAETSAGYRRLRDALAWGQPPAAPTRARSRWLIPAVTGALVLLGGAGAYRMVVPAPLTYTIQHPAIGEGGYFASPADVEAGLRFSDGSEVTLAPASRTRVAATSARGARVTLDHGSARISVVPRPGGDWTFDAGPCVVHVTGTRFEMRWSSVDQVLDVRLHSGSVTVKGPPAPAGVVMQAGQHLVMDVRRGFSRLGQAPMVTTPTTPTTTPQEAPPAPAVAERAPAAPPAARTAPSWSAQVLAGDFASVLQAARSRGIADVITHGGAADVMALAQAARLSDEAPLARRALQAVRRRFPSAAEARKAAFLLGRMAEDHDGDLARALDWYGTYLADAGGGTYLEEALGRKMAATHRLHGARPARPIADEYLRRFPTGGYADAARKIVKASP